MRDDPSVVALVARAVDGDKSAWDNVVERYAPLVWSICHRYGLTRYDAQDVAQSVWLRLVERLPLLREPAPLPGWIVTTTSRECIRVLRLAQRYEVNEPPAFDVVADSQGISVDEEVLAHERGVALRAAYQQLPPRCQLLLFLLMHDPPLPYEAISARMGMPIGSIGPNRRRCLERLRQCPVLAALIRAEIDDQGTTR